MTATDGHRPGCAFDGCTHGGHPVTDDDCPCEGLTCDCGAVPHHIGCETCGGEGVGEAVGAPWPTRWVACPDCEGSGCDPACPDLGDAS